MNVTIICPGKTTARRGHAQKDCNNTFVMSVSENLKNTQICKMCGYKVKVWKLPKWRRVEFIQIVKAPSGIFVQVVTQAQITAMIGIKARGKRSGKHRSELNRRRYEKK